MLIGLGRDRLDNNLLKIERTVFLKIGLFINNICSSLWPCFRFLIANVCMTMQGPTKSATQLLYLPGISGDHTARF